MYKIYKDLQVSLHCLCVESFLHTVLATKEQIPERRRIFRRLCLLSKTSWCQPVEEPGEQCTVVFALIVTEPAGECMCVGGGGCYIYPPSPLLYSRLRNNLWKDDSALFSRFLYDYNEIGWGCRDTMSGYPSLSHFYMQILQIYICQGRKWMRKRKRKTSATDSLLKRSKRLFSGNILYCHYL